MLRELGEAAAARAMIASSVEIGAPVLPETHPALRSARRLRERWERLDGRTSDET
jgi:hypothetical protein